MWQLKKSWQLNAKEGFEWIMLKSSRFTSSCKYIDWWKVLCGIKNPNKEPHHVNVWNSTFSSQKFLSTNRSSRQGFLSKPQRHKHQSAYGEMVEPESVTAWMQAIWPTEFRLAIKHLFALNPLVYSPHPILLPTNPTSYLHQGQYTVRILIYQPALPWVYEETSGNPQSHRENVRTPFIQH